MAVGQAVLRSTLDVGAVDAVEKRLADREAARHGAHADALRDALELHRLYEAAGMGLGTPAQLALVWRCSETRATTVLTSALLLTELPGAFELLDDAVMTVEQSGALVRGLQPLEPAVRDAVWSRLVAQLVADARDAVQRPPARLTELIRRWALQVDPEAAVKRRQQAERQAEVLFNRRDDGLVDVVLRGLTAPDAEGCLSRITAGSEPFGADDDRSAGKRRLDAAVDLLLGRTGRPRAACADDGACSGPSCGCPLSSPVPCGVGVTVLVPLATALGIGDVPAELAGHGPIEPDLLAALLASGPELRACWVGPDGRPVSMPDAVERPARGDEQAVRRSLLRLVDAPRGVPQPRHPDDHDPPEPPEPPGPPDPPGPPKPPRGSDPPDPDGPPEWSGPPEQADSLRSSQPADEPESSGRPRLLTRHHPTGTPGGYGVPSRLQRFLRVRAPRCEWPGCGARASRCDLDHDLAHPYGPTCACNAGPLCRRHHRIKQLGWTKHRTADGVNWTTPTGRQVRSPDQHLPVPAVRPPRPTATSALDELSPFELLDALWDADPADPRLDGLFADPDVDTPAEPGPATLGRWLREDRDAEQMWWIRDLAALRRAVHDTAH